MRVRFRVRVRVRVGRHTGARAPAGCGARVAAAAEGVAALSWSRVAKAQKAKRIGSKPRHSAVQIASRAASASGPW